MSIINLDSSLLRNACYYLQDRDVIAFGITSKKIQNIAKEELEARDEILTQLLSSYAISRKFNIQTLKEADLLLLGDVHHNLQCKSAQTALINFLASRGPVILILEEDFCIFNEEEKNFLCDRRNLSSRENICLMGWDDKEGTETGKKIESIKEKQLRIGEIIREMTQILNNIDLLSNDLSIEESKELENFFEQENALENHSLLMKLPIKVLEKLATAVEWQAKFPKLQKEKEELEFLIRKEVAEMGPLGRGFEIVFNDEEEMEMFRKAYTLSADHYCSEIAQQFPIRTASMVNTLKKLKNIVAQLALWRPKVVLVAGCQHLKREDLSIAGRMDDNRFNLDSLYQQLDNHKAVILLPTAPLATHRMKVQKLLQELKND